MASSRSSVIQFSDGQDAQSELQFQDFSLGENNPEVATISPSGTYSNFPDGPSSPEDETDNLLGIEKKEEASFWKFSYYQSFFDVDTSDVLGRIKWSVIPVTGRATFLDRCIRPKPDLYGPFWITATLIYTIALGSNIASYLIRVHHTAHAWSYDFHRVSLAATAVYMYAFLLPILLWGVMWYQKFSNRCTLLEIICVYGYSLAIYIPLSLLWIGPDIPWLRYTLLSIGTIFSGIVLLQTFWPIFREENKKIAAVVMSLILFFHILLAVGFGTYFFQSAKWTTSPTTNITKITVSPDEHGVSKVTRSAISNETTLLNHIKITQADLNPKNNSHSATNIVPIKLDENSHSVQNIMPEKKEGQSRVKKVPFNSLETNKL